jgi:hypothetical protein
MPHGDNGQPTCGLSFGEKLAFYIAWQPNGCVLWIGGTNRSGRPVLSDTARNTLVTVPTWLWRQTRGSVPAGMNVVSTCGNPLCIGHLGTVIGPRRGGLSPGDHVRRMCRREGDCLIWQGPLRDDGYADISIEGRKVLIHRVIWEEAHGPLPADVKLLHSCDRRPCVELGHLGRGSQHDNIADMVRKRRHQFGERSGSARLSDAQVILIRRSTEPTETLARQLDVKPATVFGARSGASWKHLDAVQPPATHTGPRNSGQWLPVLRSGGRDIYLPRVTPR